MKRIISALLAVLLAVLALAGCRKEIPAGELVFEAPVTSRRLSEFMERNPYFNPYNTISDRAGDYIYYVQIPEFPGYIRGVLRFRAGASFAEDSELCFRVDQHSRSAALDGAFTLAVNGDYIYFNQNNQLCRVRTDIWDPVEFRDFEELREPFFDGGSTNIYFLSRIRFIDNMLFTDWRNEQFLLSSIAEDGSVRSGDQAETLLQGGVSEDEFSCLALRRPWCELLPEQWQFRRYRPGEYSACIVTGKEGDMPAKEYKWNGTDSFVLVDHSAQFIYRIERTGGFDQPKSDYTVQLIDLNGEEYASVEFSVPVFDNILWSNTCDGRLYGCTERGQLVVYSIPDDELILSEKLNASGNIDVTDGLVFYRSDYGVVSVWDPDEATAEE